MKNIKSLIAILTISAIILTQMAFISVVSADEITDSNGCVITGSADYELAYTLYNADTEDAYLEITGFAKYPSAAYTLTIPATAMYNGVEYPVKSIADGAFAKGCSNTHTTEVVSYKNSKGYTNDLMKGVVFEGTNLVSIGSADSSATGVFFFCANSNFTNIDIPDNVTFIGKKTFHYCSKLKDITLGTGVTSIQFQVINHCVLLTTLTIEAEDFTFETTGSVNDNTQANTNIILKCKTLDIPGILLLINGKSSLSDYADSELMFTIASEDVRNALISAGYTEDYINYPIEEYSFSVPVGENSALNYTVSNKTAVLNGFDISGDYLLPVQLDLIIPAKATDPATGLSYTVTEIADSAFTTEKYKTDYASKSNYSNVIVGDYIYALKSVVIPDTVTKIGAAAFAFNDKLTSAVVPGSATDIGVSAFRNCRYLTTVELGEGLTSIPSMMFYTCQRLERLVIPSTVTNIDFKAIEGAQRLVYVVILGENVSFGTNVIKSGSNSSVNGTTFYVKNADIKSAIEALGSDSKYVKSITVIGTEAAGTPSLGYDSNTVTLTLPAYTDSYTVIIATFADSNYSSLENVKVYSKNNVAAGSYTFNVSTEDGKAYKAFVFKSLLNPVPLGENITF